MLICASDVAVLRSARLKVDFLTISENPSEWEDLVLDTQSGLERRWHNIASTRRFKIGRTVPYVEPALSVWETHIDANMLLAKIPSALIEDVKLRRGA